MSTIIGIDVGGSTTKIVGFRKGENGQNELIAPQFVRATDPITSIYGAFGKFTAQNGLSLSDISRVMITGAGASYVGDSLYSLECHKVPEFSCIGIGGLYLSGLDEAITVSMGTGTAIIHSKNVNGKTEIEYLGGTGVGGGTLIGLTKKILGVDTIEHIESLCEGGDLNNVDLRIRDISKSGSYPGVNLELTAANFGKLSDIANKHDIALGICNMVAETIAMISMFAARGFNLKNVVLTGNLTTIKPIQNVFCNLEGFGIKFIIPDKAQFGTVIGAALYEEN